MEVVIASTILASLVSAVYMALFTTQGQCERELTIQQGYMDLQVALDQISADLKESAGQFTRGISFVDSNFPSPAPTQGVLVMPSARDSSSAFVTVKASRAWQSLLIYAPYWNADTNEGDVRCYVVTDAATLAKFTAGSGSPSIAINQRDILLDGFAVPRSGGTKVIRMIHRMTATQNATSWVVALELRGNLTRSVKMAMGTGAGGRN